MNDVHYSSFGNDEVKYKDIQSGYDDLFEDGISLCTVTMLGFKMNSPNWQPLAENIKEVCFETPHSESIASVLSDADRLPDLRDRLLLNIWHKHLWTSGRFAHEVLKQCSR